MERLRVLEIFTSVEGEGIRVGEPVTFVRLFGCNMRCDYCDTSYSYCPSEKVVSMTVREIIAAVDVGGPKSVTLTGGEPLIHPHVDKLIKELCAKGYRVNVETNGSVDSKQFRKFHIDNLFFTMDWKSISSGVERTMRTHNPDHFKNLRKTDVIKFVVGTKADLDDMKQMIEMIRPVAKLYVSPIFGMIEPAEIADYILANKLYDVRLQVQLHKIVWPPEMRGV